MVVTITKKHCEGANYLNPWDCPLFRAIKQQHPEYPISCVGGFGQIFRRDGGRASLHPSTFDNGWRYSKMKQIQSGEIESFTITITEQKLITNE